MRRVIILLLLGISFAIADEAALQCEQANQFYRNADFRKAAELYESIARSGYENPMLYYNLGNAYFKLRDYPSAILNYERAKRLAPHDEDILYNLRLANLRITDKIEPIPRVFFEEWWMSAISQFSSDGWCGVVVFSLWLAVVAAAGFMLTRSYLMRRILFFLASAAVLIALMSCVGTVQQLHREQTEQHAIVFSASVPAKSAPDAQSLDLFVLHEGVKVEILDNVGEWRKIRLPDGKIGWLMTGDLRTI